MHVKGVHPLHMLLRRMAVQRLPPQAPVCQEPAPRQQGCLTQAAQESSDSCYAGVGAPPQHVMPGMHASVGHHVGQRTSPQSQWPARLPENL